MQYSHKNNEYKQLSDPETIIIHRHAVYFFQHNRKSKIHTLLSHSLVTAL